MSVNKSPRLKSSANCFMMSSVVSPQYTGVTDKQTPHDIYHAIHRPKRHAVKVILHRRTLTVWQCAEKVTSSFYVCCFCYLK